MAEQVLYEIDGKVGVVTLNRPNKLNALSMELRLELERVLKSADEEPKTSVIVSSTSSARRRAAISVTVALCRNDARAGFG